MLLRPICCSQRWSCTIEVVSIAREFIFNCYGEHSRRPALRSESVDRMLATGTKPCCHHSLLAPPVLIRCHVVAEVDVAAVADLAVRQAAADRPSWRFLLSRGRYHDHERRQEL